MTGSRFSELLGRLDAVCQGDQWVAKCPAHADDSPSLSITEEDGKILLHCFGKGCAVEDIVRAIGWEMRDLFSDTAAAATARAVGLPGYAHLIEKLGVEGAAESVAAERGAPPGDGASKPAGTGLTLDELAEAKHLDAGYLRSLGLRDVRRMGLPAVAIPYADEAGEVQAMRYRLALEGKLRFVWRKGDKTLPYGLPWLSLARERGWVLLVEGESDCWTCWADKVPALGIPGKANWKADWADALAGIPPDRIYIWVEPEAEDFAVRIGAPPARPGSSGPRRGRRTPAPPTSPARTSRPCWNASKRSPPRWPTPSRRTTPGGRRNARPARRYGRRRRRSVSARPRPSGRRRRRGCSRTKTPWRSSGPPSPSSATAATSVRRCWSTSTATSRVLRVQRGGMLSHLLLIGPPSAGKSYTVNVVLGLFPDFAHHEVDAGSPKVLIYDDHPLSHRVIVFGEADSLPAGEDNPAASAIRNLLQDGYLHYDVVVKEEGSGTFVVQKVSKPGPTVLFTTAVRQLGAQLMSRLFELEVPDDQEQVRSALAAQARLELEGPAVAPEGLIAYQALLQLGCPWDVIVPFAARAGAPHRPLPAASRILRDYARLLSLIKSVAVLRHRHRAKDAASRLVATLDDYEAVYELVADTYAGSASGAGAKVRAVVEAVAVLRKGAREDLRISTADVAKHVEINRMAATRRVQAALRGKWLVNREKAKGAPYDLVLGDPLPEHDGLPKPEALRTGGEPEPEPPVTPRTPGNNGLLHPVPDGGNTVTAPTGGSAPPPPPQREHREEGGEHGPSVNGVTALPLSGGDGNTPLLRPVQGVTGQRTRVVNRHHGEPYDVDVSRAGPWATRSGRRVARPRSSWPPGRTRSLLSPAGSRARATTPASSPSGGRSSSPTWGHSPARRSAAGAPGRVGWTPPTSPTSAMARCWRSWPMLRSLHRPRGCGDERRDGTADVLGGGATDRPGHDEARAPCLPAGSGVEGDWRGRLAPARSAQARLLLLQPGGGDPGGVGRRGGPVMGRPCSLCPRPDRGAIDAAALLAGEGYRNIAPRFGTSPASLSRHRGHIRLVATTPAPERNTVRCLSDEALLAGLPDGSIDVWWSSPPYNLRDPFRGGASSTARPPESRLRREQHGLGDGTYRPWPEYKSWQIRVLCEWHRTLAPGGLAFYSHKPAHDGRRMHHPVEWIARTPLVLVDRLVWDRRGTPNVDTRRVPARLGGGLPPGPPSRGLRAQPGAGEERDLPAPQPPQAGGGAATPAPRTPRWCGCASPW